MSVSVYDATLLGYVIFVFGCHQEVFDGPAPFEVYLNAIFPAYIFYTLTEAFCVRNHYVVSFDVGDVTTTRWLLLDIGITF